MSRAHCATEKGSEILRKFSLVNGIKSRWDDSTVDFTSHSQKTIPLIPFYEKNLIFPCNEQKSAAIKDKIARESVGKY